MLRIWQKKRRGMAPIVMILLLLVLFWFMWKLAGVQFRKAELLNIVSSTMIQNARNFGEEVVTTQILAQAKSQLGLELKPTAIILYRSLDGTKCRADIHYSEMLALPFSNIGFAYEIDAGVSENLKAPGIY